MGANQFRPVVSLAGIAWWAIIPSHVGQPGPRFSESLAMDFQLKFGKVIFCGNDEGTKVKGQLALSISIDDDESLTQIEFSVPFTSSPTDTIDSLREQGIAAIKRYLRTDVVALLLKDLPTSEGHLKFLNGPFRHTIGTVILWTGAGDPARPFIRCDGKYYQVINWTGAATEDAAGMDAYSYEMHREKAYDALGCHFQIFGRFHAKEPS
jgi:hypothetical protein